MEWSTASPWLVTAILLAISAGAFIKGLTGLGLPLVAVPAIATLTSVEEAVLLMVIPSFGSNISLVLNHRQHLGILGEHRNFLIAGFVGGIIGTLVLPQVDDRWLKLTLAIWLALYLIQRAFGDVLGFIFRARGAVAPLLGATAGLAQGATGVSAHIVAPYFHSRDVPPQAYALLVASAFLTVTCAQLVTSLFSHLYTTERLTLSLIALVPTLLFTRLGIGLAGKVSQQLFQRLIVAMFVVMEVKLLADVL